MKRRLVCFVVAFTVMMCLVRPVPAMAEEISQGAKVEKTSADISVMPDKYNTGCSGELTTLVWDTENAMYVGDIFINRSGNNFVLDFGYRNTDKEGTIYIENWDFSSNPLVCYNEHKVDRQVKVVFNNCKFSKMSTGKADGNMSYEFNNCTINSYNGSNSVFNRCQFGHSYSDGVVPFVDIEVNDCFFSDMAGVICEGNVHTDGTQIYGYKDLDVNNVSYNNCRFETPALHIEGSQAYVNACIMLQLEFANAKNLSFNNCIVNGGGYSIYARTKFPELTFENVGFNGIRFGAAAKYGIFYSGVHESVYVNDVAPTESLYVGSVWKDNGGTHFSVTNDTKQERKLLIYTDAGTFEYTIPACYTSDAFEGLVYEDFPFDLDIVVPADCQFAVCFDNTQAGFGTQIRFANWGNDDVYLTADVENAVYSGNPEDVVISGMCGNDVTFSLNKAGVLTLSGTGATYNFHSSKFPDWNDYKDQIKEVRVEEGVTGLGSMIFRHCTNIRSVSMPDSLTGIGQYAFGGCVCLMEVNLPKNIATIGKYAFSGMALSVATYAGNNWGAVEVLTGNDVLVNKVREWLIAGFVERMYTVALNRESDAAGKANWVTMLKVESHDGAGLAAEFILGEEFALRNLSDEEYVDVLYRTFFDREADAAGRENWLVHLQEGFSRAYVLSNFVNLPEFTELCGTYDISRGVMLEDGVAVNPGVSMFVERLYEKVLGRKADASGFYNNVVVLYYKTMTPGEVAANFFGADEYLLKNTDSATYVSDLYSVFMDRVGAEEEVAFWVACMEDSGMKREMVLAEFAASQEFAMITAGYGLN